MNMDKGEIIREYNAAKNKRLQVKILADLNLCSQKEMAQYLADNGCQVDKRYLNKRRTDNAKPAGKEVASDFLSIGEESEQETDQVMNNQSAKADAGKARLSLVPMQILFDIAEIREYGNRKYPEGGPNNWRQVEPERYREAAFRHFLRYIDDPEGLDEESGLPHRWHLECNLAFLAELEENLGLRLEARPNGEVPVSGNAADN